VLSKHILIVHSQFFFLKVFEFHPRQKDTNRRRYQQCCEIAVDEEGEKMKWKYREIKK